MGLTVDDEIFCRVVQVERPDARRAPSGEAPHPVLRSLESGRTSEDDLALLEAARLGREVRLIVTGTIATKTYTLGTGDDEELSFACTVRVASVEAGEIA
jgi:hypothetical protein